MTKDASKIVGVVEVALVDTRQAFSLVGTFEARRSAVVAGGIEKIKSSKAGMADKAR